MKTIKAHHDRIEIALRENSAKLTAYQWSGHQSSAAEGQIAVVRVIRPTAAECLAELRRRWLDMAEAGSVYVGFGGQFRNAPYYSRSEVESALDDAAEALDEAGVPV